MPGTLLGTQWWMPHNPCSQGVQGLLGTQTRDCQLPQKATRATPQNGHKWGLQREPYYSAWGIGKGFLGKQKTTSFGNKAPRMSWVGLVWLMLRVYLFLIFSRFLVSLFQVFFSLPDSSLLIWQLPSYITSYCLPPSFDQFCFTSTLQHLICIPLRRYGKENDEDTLLCRPLNGYLMCQN